MAKKSFKENNPALAFISPQNTQEVHSKLEEQEEQNTAMTYVTQGKKGYKYPRINMAFAKEHLEYLQLISRIEGISITEYVNRLVGVDKEERKDIIEQAKKLLKKISG